MLSVQCMTGFGNLRQEKIYRALRLTHFTMWAMEDVFVLYHHSTLQLVRANINMRAYNFYDTTLPTEYKRRKVLTTSYCTSRRAIIKHLTFKAPNKKCSRSHFNFLLLSFEEKKA